MLVDPGRSAFLRILLVDRLTGIVKLKDVDKDREADLHLARRVPELIPVVDAFEDRMAEIWLASILMTRALRHSRGCGAQCRLAWLAGDWLPGAVIVPPCLGAVSARCHGAPAAGPVAGGVEEPEDAGRVLAAADPFRRFFQ